MTAYADLARMSEDQRIAVIAACVADQGKTVAVMLDADEKKIARYERKILGARPGLIEIDIESGIVPKTVTLRVKPKPQNVQGN